MEPPGGKPLPNTSRTSRTGIATLGSLALPKEHPQVDTAGGFGGERAAILKFSLDF